MSELKPCPFCGGEAIEKRTCAAYNIKYEVVCTKCGCKTFKTVASPSHIIAWNTRAERTCRIEMYPLGLHEEDGEAPICSECRVTIDEDVYYCPNCGARVEVEE